MASPTDRRRLVEFRDRIVDEIVRALGFPPSGTARRLLGPIFRLSAGRFAGIASRSDAEVSAAGLPGGCRRFLSELGIVPSVRGAEGIPEAGPMLIASNHPGAYDSLAIMACVPRKDLKVVLSDVGFTRAFPAARDHFVYAPNTVRGRSQALRASLRHLDRGGAILIFPHTEVEPDPETMPGAREALGDWSRSIEIMLRRVPGTRLQLAIASGVLLPGFVKSPVVRLRRGAPQRQKLAEFLQVSLQMLFPGFVQPRVRLSFAAPVVAGDLPTDSLMPAVIAAEGRLLDAHMAAEPGSPG